MKKIRNLPEGAFLKLFFGFWAAAFLTAAFCMPDRGEMLSGLWKILSQPSKLSTSYFALGGYAATFLNMGLVCCICLSFFVIFKGTPNNASTLAVILTTGFGGWGINILNMWPSVFGVWLYCLIKKEKFGPVGEELGAYIGAQFELPIAIALIIILVAANSLGSKTASRIQVVSTVCKLIPLFLLMIFGFILGSGDNPIFTPMVGEGKSTGAVLGSTLLAVLFAFEGWTNVGAIAGEMKNPGKDMPRAIVGGVSIIMAVYFVINMAYLWVIPADELMNISSPASAVAAFVGRGMLILVSPD